MGAAAQVEKFPRDIGGRNHREIIIGIALLPITAVQDNSGIVVRLIVRG